MMKTRVPYRYAGERSFYDYNGHNTSLVSSYTHARLSFLLRVVIHYGEHL